MEYGMPTDFLTLFTPSKQWHFKWRFILICVVFPDENELFWDIIIMTNDHHLICLTLLSRRIRCGSFYHICRTATGVLYSAVLTGKQRRMDGSMTTWSVEDCYQCWRWQCWWQYHGLMTPPDTLSLGLSVPRILHCLLRPTPLIDWLLTNLAT